MLERKELSSLTRALTNLIRDKQDVVLPTEIVDGYTASAIEPLDLVAPYL